MDIRNNSLIDPRPIVLITGGNSDIAKAIELDLSKDHRPFAPGKHFLDVTNLDEIKEYFQKYTNHVDILINVAGFIYPQKVGEGKHELWLREIMVNLYGSYLMASECINRGCKLVINVGARAALEGKATWSGYSASKRALISLTESLNAEGTKAYYLGISKTRTKMRQSLMGLEDPKGLLMPFDVARKIRWIIETLPQDHTLWYTVDDRNKELQNGEKA